MFAHNYSVSILFPVVLVESVSECLLELNLDSFIVQTLTEAPDTANEFGNSERSFTVFGLRDDAVDPSVSVLGHIVNRTVEGKRLGRGSVLPTLAENVSLHFGKLDGKVGL